MAISTEGIRQRKARLQEDLGFSKVELEFILKHKPTLYMYNEESKTGVAALERLFIAKLGYDAELLRTLIVKYPIILSKNTKNIEKAFETLKDQGIEQQEAMKLFFECPSLLSVNLEKQVRLI